jgi:hypothetical protein
MKAHSMAPWRLAALLSTLALYGCMSIPPTATSVQPRRAIQPRSYKMKLAVFNFVDQTASAGKLVETIPDVLATELFSTGRFDLKERAELRGIEPADVKAIRDRYTFEVDAFLVGSITRFSVADKTMTLDVRAINAAQGTVMYAGHHDVHYEGVLDVKAQRSDIKNIAQEIETALPKLGGADTKVSSLSGNFITINLGEVNGAKVGMGALVISRGDTIKDPTTSQELGDEIVVGEAYIVEVMDKTSKAVLVPIRVRDNLGEPPKVRLGDGVRFK